MRDPGAYQTMLTAIGGLSPFGDPIFALTWSRDYRERFSTGSRYRDFRPVSDLCWLLTKWEPAAWWGTREEWEWNNREPSGLMTAGPYPAHGRYRVLKKLQRVEVRGGILRHVPLHLCAPIIDDMVPMLRGYLDLSAEQKQRLMREREQERTDAADRAFARSRDAYRISPSSVLVRRREEQIERFLRNPGRVRAAQRLLLPN